MDDTDQVLSQVTFEPSFTTGDGTQMFYAPVVLSLEYPTSAAGVIVKKEAKVILRAAVTETLLRDAILGIPDRGFATNQTKARTALLNKVAALQRMACPMCKAAADSLTWLHVHYNDMYINNGSDWTGWLSLCDKCQLRVDQSMERGGIA